MPRATYGPRVKARVRSLLDTILASVNAEFEAGSYAFKSRWEDEETPTPKLIIETTLRDLVGLGKAKSTDASITKSQVREALKRLEDFDVLVDHRADRQGAEEWNFTLKLWSLEKELNLTRFEQHWEVKRKQKQKLPQPIKQDPSVRRPRRSGGPFYAPPLPRCHISRPEHLGAVKKLLLVESTPNTLVISAIYGMGGIGKSVLAAELVRDDAVRDQFSDGVLWVTLGQAPDLLSMVNQWIRELGDFDYKPTTLAAASKHLGYLLVDKRTLLVLDDVWNSEHVKPFEIVGAGCQLLVTTRSAQILGALRYDLDVLTPKQSLGLLSNYLRRPLENRELHLAREFAQEVGYLPLALELAAALIDDGLPWEELLSDFKAEVARLEFLALDADGTLGDESQQKERSLLASFHLTLQQLTPEQIQQFAWLGVIPEDVSITPKMAATLWSVTVRQGGAILRTLKNRALLLPQAQKQGQSTSYRVHDLVHDLALNLLTKDKFIGDISGLGLPISDAHWQLLERYLEQTQDGLWSTLEDDGYIHRYLTWHMGQAKRPDLIHTLLQETTPEGKHGWYQACDWLGQVNIYIADLSRAWKFSKKLYSKDRCQSIELQIRYALIFSSLVSSNSNIPAKLISALVQKRKWSPYQALAFVQRMQNSREKGQALRELGAFLPPILLKEALELARNIDDSYDRASAFVGLVPHLPGIASETLEAVSHIQNNSEKPELIRELAPHLSQELLEELIDIVRDINDDYSDSLFELAPEYYRADAITILIPYLNIKQLEKILDLARNIDAPYSRAIALIGLIPRRPEISLETLKVANEIPRESDRTRAFYKLLSCLPEHLLPRLIEFSDNIQDESQKAVFISKSISRIPENIISVLDELPHLKDEYIQSNVLVNIIPHCSDDLLPQIVNLAKKIHSPELKSDVFIKLTSHFPGFEDHLFESIIEIQIEDNQASVIHRAAPYLSDTSLIKILDLVSCMNGIGCRTKSISGLALHLPENLLLKTLNIVRKINDESSHASALKALASHSSELMTDAFDMAWKIQPDSKLADTISFWMPSLNKYFLNKIATDTCQIKSDICQAKIFCSLVPFLPSISSEALALVRKLNNSFARAELFLELDHYLSEDLIPEALESTRSIERYFDRIRMMSKLLYCRPEIAPETLNIVSMIDECNRAPAFHNLASSLPTYCFSNALKIVRGIQDESTLSNALSALVPYMPKHLLPEALEIAGNICDNSDRVYALCSFASDYNIGQKMLREINKLEKDSSRIYALYILIPKLPDHFFLEVFEIIKNINNFSSLALISEGLPARLPEDLHLIYLDVIRDLENEYDKQILLSRLAPYLQENAIMEAFDLACNIKNESLKSNAISHLVKKLPSSLDDEILCIARAMKSKSSKAAIFRASIPRIGAQSFSISLLSEVLELESFCGRTSLLKSISELLPVIISLSDQSIIKRIALAIKDINQQWK